MLKFWSLSIHACVYTWRDTHIQGILVGVHMSGQRYLKYTLTNSYIYLLRRYHNGVSVPLYLFLFFPSFLPSIPSLLPLPPLPLDLLYFFLHVYYITATSKHLGTTQKEKQDDLCSTLETLWLFLHKAVGSPTVRKPWVSCLLPFSIKQAFPWTASPQKEKEPKWYEDFYIK